MSSNVNVFISYCKSDESLINTQAGWIDNIVKHISRVLERLIGEQPVIKTSEDQKSGKLPSSIDSCIIFSSQNYFTNEKTKKEFNEIVKLKNINIYSLELSPIEGNILPESTKKFSNYIFYKVNSETDTSFIFNPDTDFLYWFKLLDLAYDIYHTLPENIIANKKLLKKQKGTIFLAETSNDQKIKRDLLKKELQVHGYKVLPENQLPDASKDIKETVFNNLDKSFLSIHIIGEEKGRVLDNGDAIVELQNQITCDYLKTNEKEKNKSLVFRLIWLPPMLNIKDNDHRNFIERLKRDKELSLGAEIIQTPLEEFKNIIQYKISNIINSSASNVKNTTDKDSILIYLIYDKEDSKQCDELTKLIKKKGFQVISTSYDSKEITNIENHRNNLIQSDAVVIYYGNENKDWINTKLKELVKIPGYGKERPFLAKALITQNELPEINQLFYNGFEILKINGNLDPKVLQPFFQKIEKLNE